MYEGRRRDRYRSDGLTRETAPGKGGVEGVTLAEGSGHGTLGLPIVGSCVCVVSGRKGDVGLDDGVMESGHSPRTSKSKEGREKDCSVTRKSSSLDWFSWRVSRDKTYGKSLKSVRRLRLGLPIPRRSGSY